MDKAAINEAIENVGWKDNLLNYSCKFEKEISTDLCNNIILHKRKISSPCTNYQTKDCVFGGRARV